MIQLVLYRARKKSSRIVGMLFAVAVVTFNNHVIRALNIAGFAGEGETTLVAAL